MKNALLAILALTITQAARCADMQTIAYPTVKEESFEITAPKDWEMKQMEQEGDYFHLLGPTGAVFSFRTIDGNNSSMDKAIKAAMGQLKDDYKDIEMGDAQDWTPGGLKGFYIAGSAVGKKENDSVRVGMGWAALNDGKIAEFWFVADHDDDKGIAVAEKIANSLKAP